MRKSEMRSEYKDGRGDHYLSEGKREDGTGGKMAVGMLRARFTLQRLWWCPAWGTLNEVRYHGNDEPDDENCGKVAYVRDSDLRRWLERLAARVDTFCDHGEDTTDCLDSLHSLSRTIFEEAALPPAPMGNRRSSDDG